MIKEKNIVLNVVLTLVTCGIYGIVWFITMTDDVSIVNDDKELSGGKAFLFTLITCGIYSIYWSYKMGQATYEARTKRDMHANDNSVLYLVLAIFGLSIVNYCLIQNDLNEIAQAEAK